MKVLIALGRRRYLNHKERRLTIYHVSHNERRGLFKTIYTIECIVADFAVVEIEVSEWGDRRRFATSIVHPNRILTMGLQENLHVWKRCSVTALSPHNAYRTTYYLDVGDTVASSARATWDMRDPRWLCTNDEGRHGSVIKSIEAVKACLG